MWKASLQISLSVMRKKKSHLCPTYFEGGHWMVSELLLPTFKGKIQVSVLSMAVPNGFVHFELYI